MCCGFPLMRINLIFFFFWIRLTVQHEIMNKNRFSSPKRNRITNGIFFFFIRLADAKKNHLPNGMATNENKIIEFFVFLSFQIESLEQICKFFLFFFCLLLLQRMRGVPFILLEFERKINNNGTSMNNKQ